MQFQIGRRNFLQIGAVGGLSSLVNPQLFADTKNSTKSCIFIFLSGGISNVDFTNPLPNGLKEFRAVNGHIKTKNGDYIGANFPELAKISDKYSIVRSLRHNDGNHNTATHWIMTGHSNFAGGENGPQMEPSYGSIVSSLLGSNTDNGLPTYVKVNKITYDDAAWLGARHVGYPVDGEGVDNLKPRVELERMKRRLDFVNSVDRKDDLLYREWSALRSQAANISLGQASRAFKLEEESAATLEKYKVKESGFGRSLLMAKRLVKFGAKFITINNGGWDMHQQIAEGFNNRGPELDYGLSTLISDLDSSGMLKDTMVIVTSEFSRTKQNRDMGRDHNPGNCCLMIAGHNYDGKIIGKTSEDGLTSIDNIYTPDDLCWTIGNHFGISKDYTLVDFQKRPRHLFKTEAKIIG